jgi:pimeloyl-ACP methyl ester carboxylesterase
MWRRLVPSLLLVYAGVCVLMFALQRQLQYRPDPTPLDPALAVRTGRLAALHADGTGVLAMSWRGYGGSSGSPSEAGLLADARTAWAALKARAPRHPTVIFGESLGSTVAVQLAAEVQPDALVLDSSFASALAVAQYAYPWLPVPLLLHDTYRADLAAPRVRAGVLQVHCRDDPFTPLPNALPPVLLEQRCHVPSYASYRAELRALLRTCERTSPCER